MVSMTEPEFSAYQKHIAAFLTSDSAKPFSAEIFAELIAAEPIPDTGRIVEGYGEAARNDRRAVRLRLKNEESFLTRVLAQPKIWLIGGEDALAV